MISRNPKNLTVYALHTGRFQTELSKFQVHSDPTFKQLVGMQPTFSERFPCNLLIQTHGARDSRDYTLYAVPKQGDFEDQPPTYDEMRGMVEFINGYLAAIDFTQPKENL